MALIFVHAGAVYIRCASRKAQANMNGIRAAQKRRFIVEAPKKRSAEQIDLKIERLRTKLVLLKIASK